MPEFTEFPIPRKDVEDLTSQQQEDVRAAIGAIPDAPTDGKPYARQDGDWAEVNPLTPAVTQAEAEAGTEPESRTFSPLRVRQAVDFLGGPISAGYNHLSHYEYQAVDLVGSMSVLNDLRTRALNWDTSTSTVGNSRGRLRPNRNDIVLTSRTSTSGLASPSLVRAFATFSIAGAPIPASGRARWLLGKRTTEGFGLPETGSAYFGVELRERQLWAIAKTNGTNAVWQSELVGAPLVDFPVPQVELRGVYVGTGVAITWFVNGVSYATHTIDVGSVNWGLGFSMEAEVGTTTTRWRGNLRAHIVAYQTN